MDWKGTQGKLIQKRNWSLVEWAFTAIEWEYNGHVCEYVIDTR